MSKDSKITLFSDNLNSSIDDLDITLIKSLSKMLVTNLKKEKTKVVKGIWIGGAFNFSKTYNECRFLNNNFIIEYDKKNLKPLIKVILTNMNKVFYSEYILKKINIYNYNLYSKLDMTNVNILSSLGIDLSLSEKSLILGNRFGMSSKDKSESLKLLFLILANDKKLDNAFYNNIFTEYSIDKINTEISYYRYNVDNFSNYLNFIKSNKFLNDFESEFYKKTTITYDSVLKKRGGLSVYKK